MLQLEWCKRRQQRLLRIMQEKDLRKFVTQNPASVLYFTGAPVDSQWPQAFLMNESGATLLISNQEAKQSAADGNEIYDGYTLEHPFGRRTMHAELTASCMKFLSADARIGTESEFCTLQLQAASLSDELIALRRPKDPDELECIRATIRLTEAGYAAVKRALAPGLTEIDVYLLMHDAMVKHAGTSVELHGDFACGTRGIGGGGPPTSRVAEAGDLYILDIFPALEGYRCDLCRTFSVGPATDLGQDAWAHVLAAHDIAKRHLRPGGSARAVYEEVRDFLDAFEPARGSFSHHAGHGIGLDAWEYPWLIPGSGQTFVEGEVIAFEPGLYSIEMRGGVRLEHNYLVTAEGPVALDEFPMELV